MDVQGLSEQVLLLATLLGRHAALSWIRHDESDVFESHSVM
jgi:hypothetical protein